jgi:hypothetical protein
MNSANLVDNDVKSNAGNAGHYINEWKGGCPWCYCHKMANDSQIQTAIAVESCVLTCPPAIEGPFQY